ncbi:FecR family protein, partial [Escherichia coli]|nr:FecR family protein [Escherichia coli]
EIATGGDGRIEIQFDIDTYLRIAPNSIVKIKSLDYSGIAVGIRRGAAVASLRKFDRERGFFEIDLPETTVAVLKSGIY